MPSCLNLGYCKYPWKVPLPASGFDDGKASECRHWCRHQSHHVHGDHLRDDWDPVHGRCRGGRCSRRGRRWVRVELSENGPRLQPAHSVFSFGLRAAQAGFWHAPPQRRIRIASPASSSRATEFEVRILLCPHPPHTSLKLPEIGSSTSTTGTALSCGPAAGTSSALRSRLRDHPAGPPLRRRPHGCRESTRWLSTTVTASDPTESGNPLSATARPSSAAYSVPVSNHPQPLPGSFLSRGGNLG